MAISTGTVNMPFNTFIVQAKEKDLEYVCELNKRSFSGVTLLEDDDIRYYFKRLQVFLLVNAERTPYGFLFISIKKNIGYIEHLAIEPSQRKLGYGKALLDFAHNYFLQHKAKYSQLYVYVKNPAFNFYVDCGYYVIGIEDDRYDGEAGIQMQRDL